MWIPGTVTLASPLTSTTTQTTQTTTVTATTAIPLCDSRNYVNYESFFSGNNNLKEELVSDGPSSSPEQCCQLCIAARGCTNWVIAPSGCYILTDRQAAGTAQCPRGVLRVGVQPGGFGIIGPGPCGTFYAWP